MELTYDWRGFQELFYPQRRSMPTSGVPNVGPVYLVVDRKSVIAAFSDSEDLSDWVGASIDDIRAQNRHRSLYAFDREQVERCVTESLPMGQFYEQVEFLRANAQLLGATQNGDGAVAAGLPVPATQTSSPKYGASEVDRLEVNRHFLIEGVRGWWKRVLPSTYGIFIRVSDTRGGTQDFLVITRNGSLEGFHRPDLASLGADRRKQGAEVVRYLSERYLLPVQGVFVTADQWKQWSQDPNPWMEVVRAVTRKQAKLFPKRYTLVGLMGVRAVFGV